MSADNEKTLREWGEALGCKVTLRRTAQSAPEGCGECGTDLEFCCAASRLRADAERQKSAELAAALVQLQRDLVVMQQARDEAQEFCGVLQQQRNEARGEVLGLQRMLEETLKPEFSEGRCLWCGKSYAAKRGLALHLRACPKRQRGMGHA